MATHPFAIVIDGVNSGANILDDYATTSPGTPWVDPTTVRISTDANGMTGSFSFDVLQVRTPAAGPWWKSGNVYDNARVRFQVSGTTTFLGFITQIDAQLAENGLGTRATVTADAASSFLDKIIVYSGKTTSTLKATYTNPFNLGNASTTDQAMVTLLNSQVDTIMAKTTGATGTAGTTARAANRLIVDTSSTPLYTGTAVTIGQLTFPLGTYRSALDTIKEAAESYDAEQRRYWVGPDAKLRYARLGSAVPTYATAPFKIVTTPTYSPYGSTSAAATLQARDLRVSLDHDSIIKRARFVMTSNSSDWDAKISAGVYTVKDPYSRVYDAAAPNGAGMTTRNGPRPDTIIQVNPVPAKAAKPTYWTDKITTYGQKYFGSDTYPNRAAPLRSVTFSVRGADTTNNPYGYVKGYYRKADGTYALQDGWEAGQYVEINDATTIGGNTVNVLGLGGLYRIESLVMSFEKGSMIRQFDMTCERVPISPLKKFLDKA